MYNSEEENLKVIKTIVEKEEFMEMFFTVIGSYYFIRCLNEFKEKTGFGKEEIMILFHQDFDEWDKYRCKENEIALMLDYPAAEEDTIGYMDFGHFYPYVYQHGQKYIQKYPEKKKNSPVCLRRSRRVGGFKNIYDVTNYYFWQGLTQSQTLSFFIQNRILWMEMSRAARNGLSMPQDKLSWLLSEQKE